MDRLDNMDAAELGLALYMAQKINDNNISIPINFTGVVMWSEQFTKILNDIDILYNLHFEIYGLKHGVSFKNEITEQIKTLYSVPMVINSVRCDNSNIHGKGVFANRLIKKGEVITLYPADIALIKQTENGENTNTIYEFSDRFEKTRNNREKSNLEGCDWIYYYAAHRDKNIKYSGCPDLIDDSTFLGHMCNDAGTCGTNTELNRTIYTNVVSSKCNGVILPLSNGLIVVASTKDIEPDEEILVPYGYDYWISNKSNELNFVSEEAITSSEKIKPIKI